MITRHPPQKFQELQHKHKILKSNLTDFRSGCIFVWMFQAFVRLDAQGEDGHRPCRDIICTFSEIPEILPITVKVFNLKIIKIEIALNRIRTCAGRSQVISNHSP